ncbi:hypothetical protein DPMN_047984 [Dreissena polymorpha]|uniref:Uncharacterized protein n=1 Tax=Dreissena polymorpha TaxID=45954 RepID=A0A9D4I2E8_DREPO|nr:hypothetical protein DPMN_047984 [Dreissena polymorpha]
MAPLFLNFITFVCKLYCRLLLYHTHSLQKSVNYFLDPPVLPPEELEAPPEKIVSTET